ncbi:hypothetical protein [Stenotrophomonas lactitubi]|uniref:hypothetical protein n=1 Tax=Stenotrophomonas lactitubi TaxID=2045214 RepID=UPI00320ACDF2
MIQSLLDFFRPELSEEERLSIRSLRAEKVVHMSDGAFYVDTRDIKAELNEVREKTRHLIE